MSDRDFKLEGGEWFPIMHQFADAVIESDLSAMEIKLLIFFMRRTWSFRKSYADLRYKFILEKTGFNDGTLSKTLQKLKAS